MTRGDIVDVSVDGGAPLRAFVALASMNGASLVVLFDGRLDGCVGAMPLHRDPEGRYRNLMTGHAVRVVPIRATTGDEPPRSRPA